MHSIRMKITAMTIAAILTSLLTFIVIGFFTLGKENDQNSVEKMNLLSQNAAQTADARLHSLKTAVDITAHIAEHSLDTVNLKNYGVSLASLDITWRTPEQRKQLDTFMQKHLREVQQAFGNVADYTSGIVSYYYYINPEIGTSEQGFFYSKIGKPSFVKNDSMISARPDPADKENSAWYFEPVTKGRACWVGPYKAHLLGKLPTVSYVMPIYNYGVLIGVLGMDTLFYSITSPVQAMRVYDTGFAFLLNDKGQIIFHPSISAGKAPEEISTGLSANMFQEPTNGNHLIRYKMNGEERQLSFSTLSNGMKLVVTAPVAEIFSTWRQTARFILLAAIAILAVFIVATLFIAGALTKPLLQLAQASQKLASGNFNAKLDYDGEDELGILTRSFRQMRDHLQMYISDLNSRAYSDALTGIKNKGAFDIYAGRLNNSIKLSAEQDGPEFAVVMFDCNWLKEINDAYGHERGDIYLRAASHAICETFTHSPVFRLGGDEFATLLQGSDYTPRPFPIPGKKWMWPGGSPCSDRERMPVWNRSCAARTSKCTKTKGSLNLWKHRLNLRISLFLFLRYTQTESAKSRSISNRIRPGSFHLLYVIVFILFILLSSAYTADRYSPRPRTLRNADEDRYCIRCFPQNR